MPLEAVFVCVLPVVFVAESKCFFFGGERSQQIIHTKEAGRYVNIIHFWIPPSLWRFGKFHFTTGADETLGVKRTQTSAGAVHVLDNGFSHINPFAVHFDMAAIFLLTFPLITIIHLREFALDRLPLAIAESCVCIGLHFCKLFVLFAFCDRLQFTTRSAIVHESDAILDTQFINHFRFRGGDRCPFSAGSDETNFKLPLNIIITGRDGKEFIIQPPKNGIPAESNFGNDLAEYGLLMYILGDHIPLGLDNKIFHAFHSISLNPVSPSWHHQGTDFYRPTGQPLLFGAKAGILGYATADSLATAAAGINSSAVYWVDWFLYFSMLAFAPSMAVSICIASALMLFTLPSFRV